MADEIHLARQSHLIGVIPPHCAARNGMHA